VKDQQLETIAPANSDPDPAPPKVPLPIPWISTEDVPDVPLVHSSRATGRG
jgi:hypothetical protein